MRWDKSSARRKQAERLVCKKKRERSCRWHQELPNTASLFWTLSSSYSYHCEALSQPLCFLFFFGPKCFTQLQHNCKSREESNISGSDYVFFSRMQYAFFIIIIFFSSSLTLLWSYCSSDPHSLWGELSKNCFFIHKDLLSCSLHCGVMYISTVHF